MMWLCIALCFSGFSALSLSTERHYGQVFAYKDTGYRRWTLRCAGWLLLGVASAPAVIALGLSVGMAAWLAVLTCSSGVLVLLLTYQPRLIIPLSMAGPALALSAFWL